MREIFTAILAMTVTLAAVYAPIGFTQGLTGALFREFGLCARGRRGDLGLRCGHHSPMMAGRFLLPHEKECQTAWCAYRPGIRVARRALLTRAIAALDSRPVILMIVAAIFGTLIFMFTHTKSELAPGEDQGALFALVTVAAMRRPTIRNIMSTSSMRLSSDPETSRRFSIWVSAACVGRQLRIAVWRFVPWPSAAQRERDPAANSRRPVEDSRRRGAGVQSASLPGTGGFRCNTSFARSARLIKSTTSPNG